MSNPPMILIVDDVPKNIQVVAGFLKPEGYQLAFAQNGKAALEQVQKNSVDLVLLDVMMPEMDGFEVCTRLKASPETQNIPVIFLTGKVETENIVHGFELGAVDYVTKPFNREELLARVKSHLELKQAREHIQNLYDQMDEELDMASEVQNNVMRQSIDVPFLSSAMIFHPFGKVSGDMVDFSKKGSDKLGIFIGDATGHGIPAALITMMVPFILDSRGHHEYTNGIVAKMNDVFNLRQIEGKFITGIFANISSNGKLFSCNAGHPPLIILPKDGSPQIHLEKGGTAIGMFPLEIAPPYVEEEYQLAPGDKFFLYTDGITEWQNPEKELFGHSGVVACLEKNRNASVKDILKAVMKEIEVFSKGIPCNDDYTLLGFEFLGI